MNNILEKGKIFMECPKCSDFRYNGKSCRECGYKPNEKNESKYPTVTGRTDCIVKRDCEFTTGTWQCQWGTWASDHEKDRTFCEFHRDVMKLIGRHGSIYASSEKQWEEFVKDRQWNQKTRTTISWAFPDGTLPNPPFWFKPVTEQWRILTGLPVPADFSEEKVAAQGSAP